MNEFELISRLTSALPQGPEVVVGPGDDCAVLDLGVPGRHLLLKTDAVVEGVHFKADDAGEKVGHKALARCLSDVAAMAGTPVAALVTLALPAEYDVAWVESAYQGMRALASRHSTSIVGGETSVHPDRKFLSVSVLGTVPAGKAALRSGAQVGDAIFVSGELGGSLAGRHLAFEPRLEEARWLADHFGLHAMIDLSDGLAGDLRQVLNAAGVGAELMSSAIPVSRAARDAQRSGTGKKPALAAALTDGEDFELLFTVAPHEAVALLDGWRSRFPDLRLTCIGKVTADKHLLVRDRHGVRELAEHGYVHFQES